MNSGEFVAPSNLTVAKLLTEHWLPHAKTTVGGKTFQRYREIVEKKLVPAFGTSVVARLQPGPVQQAYDTWLNSGLSAQTVKHFHSVLRNAMRYAVRMGLASRNVTERVKPPALKPIEMLCLDERQSLELLEVAKGTDLDCLVNTALFSGLRRGELLALRWKDVDFGNGTMTVRQSLQETRGEPLPGKRYRPTLLEFKEPKTRKSRRTVTLAAEAIAALKRHKACQNQDRLGLGAGYSDQDLVFCSGDGRPLKPDTISKRFAALVRRVDIPSVRFHDLRHSHATQLLRPGVHFKVVSERLGHASVAITLDRYSHVLPGMDKTAADALARLYAEVRGASVVTKR
ncbi:MAG: tyrosine-type recombinase/integrase [Candidatus Tumulicola sp.]